MCRVFFDKTGGGAPLLVINILKEKQLFTELFTRGQIT
jgi:hypothetical protein